MKQQHIQLVLGRLKSRGSINPMEALNEFGCYRLAARIHDLRAAGHSIVTYTINGKTEYRMRN